MYYQIIKFIVFVIFYIYVFIIKITKIMDRLMGWAKDVYDKVI